MFLHFNTSIHSFHFQLGHYQLEMIIKVLEVLFVWLQRISSFIIIIGLYEDAMTTKYFAA